MKMRRQDFSYDSDGLLVRSPTYAIEVVMAVSAFLLGIYSSSNLYRPTVITDYAYTFQTNIWVRLGIASLLFFLPSLITFLSIFFWRLRANRWRRIATFNQFLGWMFLSIASVVNLGFYPVSWLYSFTLAMVAGICHINRRAVMEVNDG